MPTGSRLKVKRPLASVIATCGPPISRSEEICTVTPGIGSPSLSNTSPIMRLVVAANAPAEASSATRHSVTVTRRTINTS
jgi:hypothetical protein